MTASTPPTVETLSFSRSERPGVARISSMDRSPRPARPRSVPNVLDSALSWARRSSARACAARHSLSSATASSRRTSDSASPRRASASRVSPGASRNSRRSRIVGDLRSMESIPAYQDDSGQRKRQPAEGKTADRGQGSPPAPQVTPRHPALPHVPIPLIPAKAGIHARGGQCARRRTDGTLARPHPLCPFSTPHPLSF